MRNFLSVHLLLVAVAVLAAPAVSSGQVGISITIGPPALPVYTQPLCPAEGYIWTPGYWAYDYDDNDYYWVPGTWVQPPQVGLLWTPGYWGWGGSRFVFYDGYWGPQVGFYGGINYGYGYFGNGYQGGRWDHDRFFYNRSVNNVNVTVIHNVYNTTVINRTVNRVSYNGGRGGITVRPTRQQEAFAHERHVPPVSAQTQHVQAARADREQRASINHGRPAIAASPKPGDFRDRGVVHATRAGAPYTPPANRRETGQRNNQPASGRPENSTRPENNVARKATNSDRPGNTARPKEAPRRDRPAPADTGVARRESSHEKASPRPDVATRERQSTQQQQQEKDHQKMARENADQARKQQGEQRREVEARQQEQRREPQRQTPQERQRPQERPQPQEKPQPQARQQAQEKPQPERQQQHHERPEPNRNEPKPQR